MRNLQFHQRTWETNMKATDIAFLSVALTAPGFA